MSDNPDTDDIVTRLGAACVGHPHAKIPWPHRLLHDAIAEIEKLRAIYVARPADEWHEDMGPVLWWTDPIDEPPHVGGQTDLGYPIEVHTNRGVIAKGYVGGGPDYHPFFTPLPDCYRIQAALERAKEAERAAGGPHDIPAPVARPARKAPLMEPADNRPAQHVRPLVAMLSDALDQAAGVAIRAQEATEGNPITLRFDAVRRAIHRFQTHDPAMAALRAELHHWSK